MAVGKDESVTVFGVGDILIRRDDPNSIFKHVAGLLRSGDITFANLEQMLSGTGHPNPIHATDSLPRNLGALVSAGIDVVSLANNHTLDWGEVGLRDTLSMLDKSPVKYVGAGATLAEAREPVIFETKGHRVGFLAYSSTGPDGYEATAHTSGYAPVRIMTFYDKWDYQPGTPPNVESVARLDDLDAMCHDIGLLRQKCHAVVVSTHWGQHHVPRIIPDYCFTVGRLAIEAGADVVLGSHPHILKGIEHYKGGVIFYGTNNFAFDTRSSPWQEKYEEGYHVQPDPDFPTYSHHPESFRTLIAKISVAHGGVDQVSFLPCYITGSGDAPFASAEPEVLSRSDPRAQEVLDYVRDISASEKLSVGLEWSGDEIVIGPGDPALAAKGPSDRPPRGFGMLRFA